MKSTGEYLSYLRKHGYVLRESRTLAGNIVIGNVSRDSPENAIFVVSKSG